MKKKKMISGEGRWDKKYGEFMNVEVDNEKRQK